MAGRTLDKIRLEARGELPAEYRENLGEGRPNFFDGRLCRFLGVDYAALRRRTLAGGCDEEIVRWAHAKGTPRTDEECLIWNHYMTKLGWRDERSATVRERSALYGFGGAPTETIFEVLDLDEGRPPGATRSWEGPPVSAVVVMGVSGCGKTTVAQALAATLGWDFIEADLLHAPYNIAKMASGTPLDDGDRAPWLAAVRAATQASLDRGRRAVVACSALKEAYRRTLAPDPANIRFVHLAGTFHMIASRLAARSGHFMRETLLESQFEALEEPVYALRLEASEPTSAHVSRIREVLALE